MQNFEDGAKNFEDGAKNFEDGAKNSMGNGDLKSSDNDKAYYFVPFAVCHTQDPEAAH